jgi:hypothetical protein
MRSYNNMVPTFADFVTSMATLWCSQLYPYQTYAQYAPYPQRPPNSGFYPSKPPEPDSGAKVSVEIRPPNRGHYNLQVHPIPASIKVQPLQPPDPDAAKPPLIVTQNTVNQRTSLTIDIPPAQPAGDYIGSVLDAQNNHAVGNLTVTVR